MKFTIRIAFFLIFVSLSVVLSKASNKKETLKYKVLIKNLFKKIIEKNNFNGKIVLKSEGIKIQFKLLVKF